MREKKKTRSLSAIIKLYGSGQRLIELHELCNGHEGGQEAKDVASGTPSPWPSPGVLLSWVTLIEFEWPTNQIFPFASHEFASVLVKDLAFDFSVDSIQCVTVELSFPGAWDPGVETFWLARHVRPMINYPAPYAVVSSGSGRFNLLGLSFSLVVQFSLRSVHEKWTQDWDVQGDKSKSWDSSRQ